MSGKGGAATFSNLLRDGTLPQVGADPGGLIMPVDVRFLGAGDEHILNNVAAGVFDHQIDDTLRAEFLCDPRHHLCAAIEDGTVVGFASALHYVHPDKSPQLWINEVGVSPLHQGRGIAKAILKALLNLGLELGCSEAWVLTDERNAAARALYQSAGGVETAQVMVSFQLT
jgi:GNAT superfamily N-acetyltransferase